MIGKYILGAGGIALALSLAWGFRVDHLRGEWKDRFETLDKQAATVVVALKQASGNDEVTWKTTTGQILALGETRIQLERAIETQNASIAEQAREAVRMKAHAAQLQEIADKARAQRDSALKRLSNMAITPGTRADCMTLLKEADEALNIARSEGV